MARRSASWTTGARFEVWIPKTADTLDLVNFGEHLRELARRRASEIG